MKTNKEKILIEREHIKWYEVIDSLTGKQTYKIDIKKSNNDNWINIAEGNIYATQDLYKLLIHRFGY